MTSVTHSKRPLIGITADWEERSSGVTEAEYVLRSNYVEAVQQAGGMPVILPYSAGDTDALVAHLDGIIISGGMFDIHPRHYGSSAPGDGLVTKEKRTDFELDLLDWALKKRKCILGICNGMQLLAVKLGAKMHRDIQAELEGAIDHLPFRPPTRAVHDIAVAPGSRLFAISGISTTSVNSLHHQSVVDDSVLTVSARCMTDGVVEAIESSRTPFCIGVQWHPEYQISAIDKALLSAFVEAASQRHGS